MRVYAALVSRQHIWANVLQFYTAFQSAAQQRNWISEADGTEPLGDGYERIVELTRKRRALLRVLPEFERSKNNYVRRAFHNLMHETTRWTWRQRSSTAGLLEAFAPNESYNTLKACFTDFSIDDPFNLFVELDLLLRTASTNQRGEVSETLESLCANPLSRNTVLDVAQKNGAPIHVGDIEVFELRQSLPNPYRARDSRQSFSLEDWKGLSDSKIIDLIFSKEFSASFWKESLGKSWINSFLQILNENEFNVVLPGLELALPVYFFKRSINDSYELIKKKLVVLENCSVKNYLLALCEAIRSPTDVKLYNIAQQEEEKLNSKIPSFATVTKQLGPDPSVFDSETEWVESRQAVFSPRDGSLADWFQVFEGSSLHLALLVPPICWKYIQAISLPSRLDGLTSRIVKLSGNSALRVRVIYEQKTLQVDIGYFLKCLLKASRELDAKFLDDTTWLSYIGTSNFSIPSVEDALFLFNEVERQEVPPILAATILAYCATAEGIDEQMLVEFWTKHCSLQYVALSASCELLMERLLSLPGNDALKMAASIRVPHTIEKKLDLVAREVSGRYSRMLSKETVITSLDVNKLLNLPVHIDEVELWSNTQFIHSLQKSMWQLNQFFDRQLELINTQAIEHARIRPALGSIIQHRKNYIIEISLAAMDAILRLDELTSKPLEDEDWQRER